MFKNLQHTIYRLKYRYAKHLQLTVPVDLSLELASKCQLSCKMCYFSDRPNLPFKQGLMSEELALKLLRQGANFGINSFKSNWRGESTLNPAFESITSCAKSLAHGSTYIDRLTNSNFSFSPNSESIFRGLANQTKVKISCDSFNKEILEDQRLGSKYETIMTNIDKFYNHPNRIKSETIMVIQAVRSLLNKDEDIAGYVKRKWPDAQVSIRDLVSGRVNRDLSSLEARPRDNSERQACQQASARLIVHHDGKVGVCCPDISGKLIMGDANKELLYDIFNSEKARQLRKALKDKTAFKNEPCKSCSSFETYKGFKPVWKS